jgi:PhnB protein
MEKTLVQVYLFFGGRCEEALAFYKEAIGAQIEPSMRFSDSPEPIPAGMIIPGFEDKIMHTSFRIGQTQVMASDGCNPDDGKHGGFSLVLTVPTVADVDRTFAALAEGGTITMPPCQTFWSERYGMLKDRFGVSWMVMVAE